MKADVREQRYLFAQGESTPFGIFLNRLGLKRERILVRAIIRRRWQKLGIWNKDWGIEPQIGGTNDRVNEFDCLTQPRMWDWSWGENRELMEDESNPNQRAVLQRAGLRRGEFVKPSPQSIPTALCSQSEGESFIISRPWFQFELEMLEEKCRKERLKALGLDTHLKPNPKYASIHERWKATFYYEKCMNYHSEYWAVRERWEANGLWKETWDPSTLPLIFRPGRPGWRWRDESPSPEPEDLYDFVNIAAAGFTQEELEAIDNAPPDTLAATRQGLRQKKPHEIGRGPTVKELFEEANAAVDSAASQDGIDEPGASAPRRSTERGSRGRKGLGRAKTTLNTRPNSKPQVKAGKGAEATLAQSKKIKGTLDKGQKRTRNTVQERRSQRVAVQQTEG